MARSNSSSRHRPADGLWQCCRFEYGEFETPVIVLTIRVRIWSGGREQTLSNAVDSIVKMINEGCLLSEVKVSD